jgi:hypothetical protein
MEINIKEYLTENEIKVIAKEEVRKYIRDVIGTQSDSAVNKEYHFIAKLARQLAKEGCQELIPNFEELINKHIKEEIKTIKIADLFWETMGWRSQGNKMINKILAANESLIEAKVKQIFAP